MLEKLRSQLLNTATKFRRRKVKRRVDTDTGLYDLQKEAEAARTFAATATNDSDFSAADSQASAALHTGAEASYASNSRIAEGAVSQSSGSNSQDNAGFSNIGVIGNGTDLDMQQGSTRQRGRKYFDYSDDSCTRFLPASYVVCDKDPDDMLDADDLQDTDRILAKSSHYLRSYYFLSTLKEKKTSKGGRESILHRGKGRRPAAVAIEDKAYVEGRKATTGKQVFFHGGLPGVHETDMNKPQQPVPMGVGAEW